MTKTKTYYGTRFTVSVINEALKEFHSLYREDQLIYAMLNLDFGNESWQFDTLEEFLASYENAEKFHLYALRPADRYSTGIALSGDRRSCTISVGGKERSSLERIFSVFERHTDECAVLVVGRDISIFIGHGRDQQWRDLKDHLQDFHGFKVVAYESGPRAGSGIKEVLESMVKESSFALLVLTGEDIKNEGELHARENVIHELGLFQGAFSFTKAIALVEEGVELFSNIVGVNQIRFSGGHIRETFGDVLATIKREFGEDI